MFPSTGSSRLSLRRMFVLLLAETRETIVFSRRGRKSRGASWGILAVLSLLLSSCRHHRRHAWLTTIDRLRNICTRFMRNIGNNRRVLLFKRGKRSRPNSSTCLEYKRIVNEAESMWNLTILTRFVSHYRGEWSSPFLPATNYFTGRHPLSLLLSRSRLTLRPGLQLVWEWIPADAGFPAGSGR